MRAADHRAVRARARRRAQEHHREIGASPCCALAQPIAPGHPAYPFRDFRCVCAWIEYCPEHGTAHVGSHE